VWAFWNVSPLHCLCRHYLRQSGCLTELTECGRIVVHHVNHGLSCFIVAAGHAKALNKLPKAPWYGPGFCLWRFGFPVMGGGHMHDLVPSLSMGCEGLGLFASRPDPSVPHARWGRPTWQVFLWVENVCDAQGSAGNNATQEVDLKEQQAPVRGICS
jgi:hypothetical protein